MEEAVSEIFNEFLCFRCVELEVVIKAPADCLGYLLKVSVFSVVGHESNHGGVVCILKKGDWAV